MRKFAAVVAVVSLPAAAATTAPLAHVSTVESSFVRGAPTESDFAAQCTPEPNIQRSARAPLRVGAVPDAAVLKWVAPPLPPPGPPPPSGPYTGGFSTMVIGGSEIDYQQPRVIDGQPIEFDGQTGGHQHLVRLYDATFVGADSSGTPQQAILGGDGLGFCGGTWIGKRWVLTAAHCVSGRTSDGILVGLLEHNIAPEATDGVPPCAQRVRAKRLYVPSEYAGLGAGSDIALILLEEYDFKCPTLTPKYALIDRGDAWPSWCPSHLGVADHSNTPCIRTDYDHPLWRQTAPRGWHAADDPLRAATVSGWGETTQTAADVQSATPNYRELRMYTPLECNDFFLRAGKTAWFTTSGLGASCAGTPPGEPYAGSCQGDSGGPLVVYRHVGGSADPVAVVVGVVSFGDCGDDPTNLPTVYTQVSYFHSAAIDRYTGYGFSGQSSDADGYSDGAEPPSYYEPDWCEEAIAARAEVPSCMDVGDDAACVGAYERGSATDADLATPCEWATGAGCWPAMAAFSCPPGGAAAPAPPPPATPICANMGQYGARAVTSQCSNHDGTDEATCEHHRMERKDGTVSPCNWNGGASTCIAGYSDRYGCPPPPSPSPSPSLPPPRT